MSCFATANSAVDDALVELDPESIGNDVEAVEEVSRHRVSTQVLFLVPERFGPAEELPGAGRWVLPAIGGLGHRD